MPAQPAPAGAQPGPIVAGDRQREVAPDPRPGRHQHRTAAVELQPDVVVMDLHMPGVNGVEATRTIVAQSAHIGVLN